jgi:sulfur-carrier protein
VIRVRLPAQLRSLASLDGEVEVDVAGPVTLGAVLDALEAGHPASSARSATGRAGSVGDGADLFADGEDLSDADPGTPLPDGGGTRRTSRC